MRSCWRPRRRRGPATDRRSRRRCRRGRPRGRRAGPGRHRDAGRDRSGRWPALAEDNIRRNGLADRVRAVVLDAAAAARAFAAAGSAGRVGDPRDDESAVQRSGAAADLARSRRGGWLMPQGRTCCPRWIRTAARLLRPRGTLTVIWRADGLAEVLRALETAFGEVMVLPVHAKPAAPAIRVLVRATKSSRTPLTLLPGLRARRCRRTADGRGRSRAAGRFGVAARPSPAGRSALRLLRRFVPAREMRQRSNCTDQNHQHVDFHRAPPQFGNPRRYEAIGARMVDER